MGELESRAQNITSNIDQLAADYIVNKNLYSANEKKKTMEHIKSQFVKTKEYADDNFQLATQNYQLVSNNHLHNIIHLLLHGISCDIFSGG